MLFSTFMQPMKLRTCRKIIIITCRIQFSHTSNLHPQVSCLHLDCLCVVTIYRYKLFLLVYMVTQLIMICPHRNIDFDPNCEDRHTCPELMEEVKNFIETYLQGISSSPSVKECCTVTVSQSNL